MKHKQGTRFYIKTFGCQMNKYDSGIMADRLVSAGYLPTQSPEDAGIILFNSCSVREHAKNRLIGAANSMKPLKRKNPSLIIAICGCVAQEEGERLFEKIPHADIVLGTRRFPEILSAIRQYMASKIPAARTEEEAAEDIIPGCRISGIGPSAFVPVLRGCSNFCSYCIVPYLRGPEISRKPEEIISEMEMLAAEGIKEVCLLGQNVLAYGKDLSPSANFPFLLEKASKVPGLERIRFLTSHPRDIGAGLISGMRDIPGVCPEIHLPVQSGSDRILSLMGRGYTRGRLLELISGLRAEIPGISVTTDVICGFPTEEEKDFMDTLALLEEVRFDDAFLYRYSPREGTAAAFMDDSVPEEKKRARLARLIEVQKKISGEKNLGLAGAELEVLVEGESRKSPGMVFGRTPGGKNVVFEGGPGLSGRTVKVRITGTGPFTLRGEPLLF